MPTVLVYRSEMLPPSETFIYAQASSLSRYTAHFVGLRAAENSLLDQDRCTLAERYCRLPRALRGLSYDYLALQPALHDRRFLDELRSLAPSLLHVHFAPDALTALPLATALTIPMLVTLHGYDVTVRLAARNPLRAALRRLRMQTLHQQATAFLCVSEFIRAKALAAGYPESKLIVHHIGIDIDTFQPATSQQGRSDSVLFVGRLTEKKGCEYLIRAMAEVQQSAPSAKLIVIGEGQLRGPLQALAAELQVNCEFLGRQDHLSVRRHIAAARLCVVPSVTAANGDSEGLPMFLAEAQGLGVPVVGTRHAGIPEGIVRGHHGMLSDERDVHELAVNIQRLLNDDALHADVARRGVALVQREFDLRCQTQKLEAVYDSVVAGASAQAKSFARARATA
jgi:colanic acid/amylovoran biosynthesis glycosyltransferase